jgi:hypothetical protein
VSVTAAGVAVALVRHRWVATAGLAALVVAAAVTAGPVALHDSADTFDQSAVTVGKYIRERALPGQTAYVLYAKVNILFYTGGSVRPAFPYNWSLMMRSAPQAQAKLRSELASPQRPTWLVQWQGSRSFGLDRNGVTKRLIARNYTRATTLCGHRVFLARGAPARAAPPVAHGCDLPGGDQGLI